MKIGSLVECVDVSNFNILPNHTYPVKGNVYTIREFQKTSNEYYILLEEIINPFWQRKDGSYGEGGWFPKRFKELMPPMVIDIEEILEKVTVF